MQTRRIIIPNRLGLHARAAAKLVRLANSFRCSVQLARCDVPARSADAKNILGVLLLAATQHTELQMLTEGEDEAAAIEALCRLIEEKFGEKE
jgi:phosphocarrier protein